MQTDIDISTGASSLKVIAKEIKTAKDKFCDKSQELSGGLIKQGSMHEANDVKKVRHRLLNEASQVISLINQKLLELDVSEVSNFDVYSERSVPVIDNIPNVSNVQNDVPTEPVCELNHSTNFVNTSANVHNNQFPLHSEGTQHGLVTSFQNLSVKPKQRRFDAVEIPNVTCMPFSQPDEHLSADKHFHASLPNINAPISNAYSVSNNSAPNIIPCSSYLVTCSAASSNYVGSMSYHNQVPFQNTVPSFSQHVPPFRPKMSVIPPKSNHDANMYKCPFQSTTAFFVQINPTQVQINLCQIQINLSQIQINLFQIQINLCQIQINLSQIQINLCQIQIHLCQIQIHLCQIQINLCRIQINPF